MYPHTYMYKEREREIERGIRCSLAHAFQEMRDEADVPKKLEIAESCKACWAERVGQVTDNIYSYIRHSSTRRTWCVRHSRPPAGQAASRTHGHGSMRGQHLGRRKHATVLVGVLCAQHQQRHNPQCTNTPSDTPPSNRFSARSHVHARGTMRGIMLRPLYMHVWQHRGHICPAKPSALHNDGDSVVHFPVSYISRACGSMWGSRERHPQV